MSRPKIRLTMSAPASPENKPKPVEPSDKLPGKEFLDKPYSPSKKQPRTALSLLNDIQRFDSVEWEKRFDESLKSINLEMSVEEVDVEDEASCTPTTSASSSSGTLSLTLTASYSGSSKVDGTGVPGYVGDLVGPPGFEVEGVDDRRPSGTPPMDSAISAPGSGSSYAKESVSEDDFKGISSAEKLDADVMEVEYDEKFSGTPEADISVLRKVEDIMSDPISKSAPSVSAVEERKRRRVRFISGDNPEETALLPSGSSTSSTGSTGGSPKPGILRKISSPEEVALILKNDEQRKYYLRQLSKGGKILKFHLRKAMVAAASSAASKAAQKPSERYFRVTKGGTELSWQKSTIGSMRPASKIELATVVGMRLGPRTEVFGAFDWKQGRPWLCFSLLMSERSLDLQCRNRKEFLDWYLGLRSLIPLSHHSPNKPRLLWYRAVFKSAQLSFAVEKPVLEVWADLVRGTKMALQGDPTEMNTSKTWLRAKKFVVEWGES